MKESENGKCSFIKVDVFNKLEFIKNYKFSSSDITTIKVGRNEDCEIKLNFDKTYSKNHCNINWDEKNKVWYISDGINGSSKMEHGFLLEKVFLYWRQVL